MFRSLAVRGARAGFQGGAPRSNCALLKAMAVQQRTFRASAATEYKRAPEEPLPPSIIEKYQLDEPSRYLPLTLGTFSLATATGLYHVDAETQLLAVWMLFVGVVYSRGGPAISEFLEEMTLAIEKEHAEVEVLELKAATAVLAAAKNVTVIHSDITALFDAQKELTAELLAGAQNTYKHAMRAAFVKQLDSLVAIEKKFGEETSALIVQSATAAVKKAYLPGGDAVLKNTALESALAALSNPKDAKRDPAVGKMYSAYLGDFNRKYSADIGKEQKISKATQAVMKEAMESVARREGLDLANIKVAETVALR